MFFTFVSTTRFSGFAFSVRQYAALHSSNICVTRLLLISYVFHLYLTVHHYIEASGWTPTHTVGNPSSMDGAPTTGWKSIHWTGISPWVGWISNHLSQMGGWKSNHPWVNARPRNIKSFVNRVWCSGGSESRAPNVRLCSSNCPHLQLDLIHSLPCTLLINLFPLKIHMERFLYTINIYWVIVVFSM